MPCKAACLPPSVCVDNQPLFLPVVAESIAISRAHTTSHQITAEQNCFGKEQCGWDTKGCDIDIKWNMWREGCTPGHAQHNYSSRHSFHRTLIPILHRLNRKENSTRFMRANLNPNRFPRFSLISRTEKAAFLLNKSSSFLLSFTTLSLNLNLFLCVCVCVPLGL